MRTTRHFQRKNASFLRFLRGARGGGGGGRGGKHEYFVLRTEGREGTVTRDQRNREGVLVSLALIYLRSVGSDRPSNLFAIRALQNRKSEVLRWKKRPPLSTIVSGVCDRGYAAPSQVLTAATSEFLCVRCAITAGRFRWGGREH